MFSLPVLPTDNLYKFIFIGGLICLISSFFLLDKVINNQIEDSKTLDSLHAVNTARTTLISEELKKIDVTVKSANKVTTEINKEIQKLLKNRLRNTSIGEDLVIKASRAQAELLLAKEVNDSIKKDGVQNDKDRSLIEAKLNARKSIQEQNESNSSSLGGLGIIMLIIGGVLWYSETQKVQDDILKLSLKLAKIEYDEKSKNVTPENRSTESTNESTSEHSNENV